ncbi:MAG: NAD(P)H-dependent oxidoreductase subunit E [Dehalococcoidia bacterium]|nr:NAD(P)H-dependent oxidoreductase subunit E [Dehalococcoidia bacterium]
MSAADTAGRDLLLLLERAREVYGYVPDHVLLGLANELHMPVAEVYATATFYRGLPLRPPGRHVIRICKSVPCYLRHNGPVIDAVREELGISPGETTHDGLFSLELVNCIGACDKAPAMMIDGDVFGHLTPTGVGEILAGYR